MTTLTATRRPVPALGGFSVEFLKLEARRTLRNRRTSILALIMPAVLFVTFAAQSSYRTTPYGSGNLTSFFMVSIALYGAMLATASGGAAVSVERAAGWSRQLRLTPLRPIAYIATKVVVALLLGLLSVAGVFIIGLIFGAKLSPVAWVSCFLIVWLGSLVFAAFGLFLGYLLPAENVMQLLSLAMVLMSFGGGLFIKLSGWAATASKVIPTSGVATLARAPFGDIDVGSIAVAAVNVVVWGAVFAGGAAVMFRRDTAR
ncbi:ABC transporter permease [Nocardia terpenica]|uniref:ABC transporter permease n=1 Tax=Nocardia terpenica TaxID=455432 RepID=A0A6G9YZM9_9NOCA|nr:ABC transporter permease [Nocardia terpenica]QIS18785.1 ABC transporter permease [Nocardia terpenica]